MKQESFLFTGSEVLNPAPTLTQQRRSVASSTHQAPRAQPLARRLGAVPTGSAWLPPRSSGLLPPVHAWGSGAGSQGSAGSELLIQSSPWCCAGALVPGQGMLRIRSRPSRRRAAPCTWPSVAGHGVAGTGAVARVGAAAHSDSASHFALPKRPGVGQEGAGTRQPLATNPPRTPGPAESLRPHHKAGHWTMGARRGRAHGAGDAGRRSGCQLTATAAAASSPAQPALPRRRGGNL